jgi:hypothetical protein
MRGSIGLVLFHSIPPWQEKCRSGFQFLKGKVQEHAVIGWCYGLIKIVRTKEKSTSAFNGVQFLWRDGASDWRSKIGGRVSGILFGWLGSWRLCQPHSVHVLQWRPRVSHSRSKRAAYMNLSMTSVDLTQFKSGFLGLTWSR